MTKDKKISIAKSLASQLHVTEEAIDTALSEAAHLVEAYVASRRAIRLSAVIAGDAHRHTLKAMLALNKAQRHMTAAHEALQVVQDRLGLSAVAIVPPDDKPAPKDPDPAGVAPESKAKAF